MILTDALYVRGYKISGTHFVVALAIGLIVAKVMLIANALPFVDAFPERPLIYNTVWKTAIHSILAVAFYLAEHYAKAAVEANSEPPVPWYRFWMVIIWLVLAFLVFAGYSELDRKIGHGRIRAMFLAGYRERD